MTIGVCRYCDCLFLMKTGKEPGCRRCCGTLNPVKEDELDMPAKPLTYNATADIEFEWLVDIPAQT